MEIFLLNIFVIFLLIALSAFFSGSESALFSLTKSDLHRYSGSKSTLEQAIARTMGKAQNILITILIGNLFVNIILSMLTTHLLLAEFPIYGHFISIAIITPVIVLVCELAPKIISINAYEQASKKMFPVLFIFHRLFYPVRLILLLITNGIIKIFKLKVSHKKLTEQELDVVLHAGEEKGFLEKEEKGFIQNILRFSKMEAGNIMYPRNRALFLSEEDTVERARRICIENNVARIPVYKGDIDHVTGMLDCRELMPYFMGYKKAKTIKRLIHPIAFFPETRELNDLLNDFLVQRIEMAILVDEYGGTAGVVTLSKILSEIMGREFSKSKSELKTEIRHIDEVTAIVTGDMQLHAFNEAFATEIESDNADTIGGCIIEHLGHFPKPGEEIIIDGISVIVKRIKRNQIMKVEVIRS